MRLPTAPLQTMIVHCKCGKRYDAPDADRQRRYQCKACGGIVVVPAASAPVDDEYSLAADPSDNSPVAAPVFKPAMRAASFGGGARSPRRYLADLIWQGVAIAVLALVFLGILLLNVSGLSALRGGSTQEGASRFSLSLLAVLITGVVCLLLGIRTLKPAAKTAADVDRRRKNVAANRARGASQFLGGLAACSIGIGIILVSDPSVLSQLPGLLRFILAGTILGGLVSMIMGFFSFIFGVKVGR